MNIDPNIVTPILAVGLFLSSVIVPVITAWSAGKDRVEARRREREEREETRRSTERAHIEMLRKERQAHLLELANKLIVNRANLQKYIHGSYDSGHREEAYGATFAIMLFIEDNDIRTQAQIVRDNQEHAPRLRAVDAAIHRLGILYSQTLN